MREFGKLDVTSGHIAAIDHVRQLAKRYRRSARSELEAIIASAGLRASAVVEILDAVRTHARVAIHFHPDRLFADGKTVAQGLLEAGVYKNQYETGISGGRPTAFVGGERHGWEEALFGGAYSRVESGLTSRPKYGALQIWRHTDGPSPHGVVEEVAVVGGDDPVLHVVPETAGRDIVAARVAVNGVVAPGAGVVGEVGEGVVDLAGEQERAVIEPGQGELPREGQVDAEAYSALPSPA